jgi:DNA-binding response OmpR family regulator
VDVVLIRYPVDVVRRERLAAASAPRLLLVEAGAPAPISVDCLEDWIRVPAPEADVRARLDALRVRAESHAVAVPELDQYGVLRYDGMWVSLPPVEARLAAAMLDRFGAVVSREALSRAGWRDSAPGRNALDVHVLRLRRRVGPIGLRIRTVRARGYLLEGGEARKLEA